MGDIPRLFCPVRPSFRQLAALSHYEDSRPPSFCSLATGPSTSGHQLSSSSPTGFTDMTVLGYGLAAVGTKPEILSALQNSQVVPGVYRFLPKYRFLKHT